MVPKIKVKKKNLVQKKLKIKLFTKVKLSLIAPKNVEKIFPCLPPLLPECEPVSCRVKEL